MRGLLSSARPCGATCQLQPPTPSQRCVSRVAQARLRSLSLGRRRSTRSCCCTSAVSRWLWSAHALKKGITPTRGLFPSARVRGATCQLRTLTPSQRRASCDAGAPALAVAGEEAQHSSLLLRARRDALLMVGPRSVEGHCAGERPFSFGAARVRRAGCGLQRQACRAAQAPALAVTRQEAQHSVLLLYERRVTLVMVG